MNSRHAFSFYAKIHLHFLSENYSALKYGNNTKHINDKFDSLSINVKYRYNWLSEKFKSEENVVFACIGSELNDIDIKFADKESILE